MPRLFLGQLQWLPYTAETDVSLWVPDRPPPKKRHTKNGVPSHGMT